MLKRLMEILKKKELDYNSFFFLYRLVNNIEIDVKGDINHELLIRYNYIRLENNTISFTQNGINFIKDAAKELKRAIVKEIKNADQALKDQINDWIVEYRNLYKGTKVGIMGDPKSCLEKMCRFFVEYPQYANKDLILNATKKYIETEAFTNYKYLQRADYFIYKITGKEESSRLASFCSDIEENKSLEHSFTQIL
jgi:hypothetical protein